MQLLDTNQDGKLDFDEFLKGIKNRKIIKGIRGKPNARRQAMIDKAFLKFDKDGNGVITSIDLRGVYNCKAHPKVQNG